MTVIGGAVKVLGTIKCKITFNGIKLDIDVDLLVLQQNVLTMLSLRDMEMNSLDISLHKLHLSVEYKTHNLSI